MFSKYHQVLTQNPTKIKNDVQNPTQIDNALARGSIQMQSYQEEVLNTGKHKFPHEVT